MGHDLVQGSNIGPLCVWVWHRWSSSFEKVKRYKAKHSEQNHFHKTLTNAITPKAIHEKLQIQLQLKMNFICIGIFFLCSLRLWNSSHLWFKWIFKNLIHTNLSVQRWLLPCYNNIKQQWLIARSSLPDSVPSVSSRRVFVFVCSTPRWWMTAAVGKITLLLVLQHLGLWHHWGVLV